MNQTSLANLLWVFPLLIKHDNLIDTEHDTGASDLASKICTKLRGLSVIQDGTGQGHADGVSPTCLRDSQIGRTLQHARGMWELCEKVVVLPLLLCFCSSLSLSAASCSFCFSNCLISLASFLCFWASFTVYEEDSLTNHGHDLR